MAKWKEKSKRGSISIFRHREPIGQDRKWYYHFAQNGRCSYGTVEHSRFWNGLSDVAHDLKLNHSHILERIVINGTQGGIELEFKRGVNAKELDEHFVAIAKKAYGDYFPSRKIGYSK